MAKVEVAPVKTKELIRLVSKSTKYHIYEVEDVLSHLVAHIQNILGEGKSVKLNGIGTISRKYFKPRVFKMQGQEPVMVYNQVSLTIKLDFTMRNFLKGTYNANNTANTTDD